MNGPRDGRRVLSEFIIRLVYAIATVRYKLPVVGTMFEQAFKIMLGGLNNFSRIDVVENQSF